MTEIKVGDNRRAPEIPADLELIKGVIRDNRAKLVIIEPLAAFAFGADCRCICPSASSAMPVLA